MPKDLALLVGLLLGLGLLLASCGGGTPAGPSSATSAPEATDPTAAEQRSAAATEPPGCTFAHGVTTCVTTTQHVETTTHGEVSGCMAFNGSAFVPGRRTRTFEDQVMVTLTTATRRHGRQGAVIDTQTTSQSQILSSRLVSDVCQPI